MDYLKQYQVKQITSENECIRDAYEEFLKSYSVHKYEIVDMYSEGGFSSGRATCYIEFVKCGSIYEFRYYDGYNGIEKSITKIRDI